MKTMFYLTFYFFINQVNIKLLSYGDEVAAAFYYCHLL